MTDPSTSAREWLEANPINPPHIQRIPVMGEAYTKADVVKAMEAFSAPLQAENERLLYKTAQMNTEVERLKAELAQAQQELKRAPVQGYSAGIPLK